MKYNSNFETQFFHQVNSDCDLLLILRSPYQAPIFWQFCFSKDDIHFHETNRQIGNLHNIIHVKQYYYGRPYVGSMKTESESDSSSSAKASNSYTITSKDPIDTSIHSVEENILIRDIQNSSSILNNQKSMLANHQLHRTVAQDKDLSFAADESRRIEIIRKRGTNLSHRTSRFDIVREEISEENSYGRIMRDYLFSV